MGAKASNPVTNDKTVIRSIVENALGGKPHAMKESFDKLMHQRSMRLVREERERVANVVFSHGIPRGKMGLKEEDAGVGATMYGTVYVIDPDLFDKEKPHMPGWLQKATEDGSSIEPVKEKDAIDLSAKYHSIEFADA